MDMALLVGFAAAAFVLSIAPGPDMMFIVAHAATGGRRGGLVAAAGMSTGVVGHTLAVAFGLGAVIQAAPAALDAVRVVGALFLVYLAVSTWRASRSHQENPPEPRNQSLGRVYAMAALTNLANPKVVLFYLAFLPQFLTAGAGSWPVTVQLLTLGAVLLVVGLAVDALVGVLAGTLSERLLWRGSAFRRWLDRMAAVVFGGLAARIALDAR